MVTYLKKPEGSEGFHQIVDFLNASHIRYALTKNSTIYVSPIKQFWQTATARTLDNGEIELTATIDATINIVTKKSIRRHLQLADADGFIQVFLNKNKRLLQPHTRLYIAPTHTQILFSNMKRASKGFTKENILLFPAMIVQGLVVQGERSTHPTLIVDETVHEERGDSVERAATTATSLDVEQDIGNINRTQSMAIPNDPFPHRIGSGSSLRHQDTILGDGHAQTRFERLFKQSNDPPLSRVNTLRSGEDSMTQQELMVFCTTLSKKVTKLEKIVKSSQAKRRARIVVSDDEDDLEDNSKQGRKIAEIDQDPGISLVHQDEEIQGRYEHDIEFDFDFDAAKEVSTAGEAVTTASVAVSTASPTRNTRVSTADEITIAETLEYIRKSASKDKGKGKMDESKKVKTKTKLQQEQERLDFKAAMRLQTKLEEEERQRIVR
ncbi:hypothetical protein Tco_1452266 [Tanacetum coccineum]